MALTTSLVDLAVLVVEPSQMQAHLLQRMLSHQGVKRIEIVDSLAAVRQEVVRMSRFVEHQVEQMMACFVGSACLRETGLVERGDARIDRMQAEEK